MNCIETYGRCVLFDQCFAVCSTAVSWERVERLWCGAYAVVLGRTGVALTWGVPNMRCRGELGRRMGNPAQVEYAGG